MQNSFNQYPELFKEVSENQLDRIKRHVWERIAMKDKRDGLGVVFDVTYWCNLHCTACVTAPGVYRDPGPLPEEMQETTTEEIFGILCKIHDYQSARAGLDVFINYGGGEPFLRRDIKQIIRETARLFGPSSVGLDTNGTISSIDDIEEIAPHLSYLGISLDGLAETHNAWRKPQRGTNAYGTTLALIRAIAQRRDIAEKLEVSSVASKNNLQEIPKLMRELASIGVKKYSVHRFFQVGRGWRIIDLVPDARDYLHLLTGILETADELGIEAHLHHSIESIYATLLFGVNTYAADKIGNPVRRSSIAINPHGDVFFDPWCMKPPWKQLSAGSLLTKVATLENLLHGDNTGVLEITRQYTNRAVRCRGCLQPCSGGARIAAAANFVLREPDIRSREITLNHLLAGLAEVDPACPLYWEGYGRDELSPIAGSSAKSN